MNTLDLLLSSACSVSYVTMIEDRDTDATSYWFDVTFEMTPLDQRLGIQVLTLTISDEVYARYKDQLGTPTYTQVQQGDLPRVTPPPIALT